MLRFVPLALTGLLVVASLGFAWARREWEGVLMAGLVLLIAVKGLGVSLRPWR